MIAEDDEHAVARPQPGQGREGLGAGLRPVDQVAGQADQVRREGVHALDVLAKLAQAEVRADVQVGEVDDAEAVERGRQPTHGDLEVGDGELAPPEGVAVAEEAGHACEARVHQPVVRAREVRAGDQRTHAPQRTGQREEERQEDRAERDRNVDADERADERAHVPGARDDPAVQRVDRERREEVCGARDVHPRDEEHPRGTRPLRERDEPEQQAEERAEEGALRSLGEAERLGEPPRGLHGRRHHACRVVMPPSTGMTAPVRNAPAREAR